jgi:hypothetical protein
MLQFGGGDVTDHRDVRAGCARGRSPGQDREGATIPRRAQERNAALNYRSVLARELTVEDAPVYLQTRQARRSRRPRLGDGAPESV